MLTIQRYFLKKTDRLKSRNAIDIMFTKGKSFSNFPFRVLWMNAENDDGLKAGFSASTKNFKKATDRNKIKRLMREAYRLQKNDLDVQLSLNKKTLNIFFIYTGKEIPTYNLIFEKMGNVFKRIIKLTDEKFQ